MRQAYDYWQNQPDCSWFCSNLTTHTSPRLPATRAFRTGREGIGKVVTFKLGYVRSVSFLQPVSVRKERHRESERVHTDDSQNRTGRSASVRHSIVAHSLFPCPDTSLKERANKLARGGFTSRCVTECLLPFVRRGTSLLCLSATSPQRMSSPRCAGFVHSLPRHPIDRTAEKQNPVISAAAGLMRMVLFRRLRISYQHKQSNLRLEYSRRPKTGQTLVQDRRTS